MSSGILEREMQELLSTLTFPLKKKNSPPVKKKKVLVIAGPTAVGKTQLSLIMARALGGEIISADSMQVYRGMDVGTAKVSRQVREEIPHHLIDIRELSESFNVMDFYQQAQAAIREILLKEHVPIVVGGTGFYLNALLYGPPAGPSAVPEVRQKLEEEMARLGPLVLYERLQLLDPDYAATITRGDRHKIVRALEIISLSARKVSDFSCSTKEYDSLYDFRCWFVYMPREGLYPRIEQRCDQMLKEGFVDEVRGLLSLGLKGNTSASQAIGYRQALEFLESAQTSEDWERFVREFKQASRRYAKRQFTWFRKEPLFRQLNLVETPESLAAEIIMQDYEFSDGQK